MTRLSTSVLRSERNRYVRVRERMTLCALQKQRVVAAAHLLRYGNGPEVNPSYQNAGDLAWFFAWPNAGTAAAALLAAARRQFAVWRVTREYAWDAGLPVGPFVGVPDVWPHVALALEEAGYHPRAGKEGVEMVYGGPLDAALPQGSPPIAGLTLQRVTGAIDGACFVALVNGEVVGKVEYATDLTRVGILPALRGWAHTYCGTSSVLPLDSVVWYGVYTLWRKEGER